MKVYTKSGDTGTTSLIGGLRVSKDDARVEAYGTVDELTAFISLLYAKLSQEPITQKWVTPLERINSKLMSVEALLAATPESVKSLPQIEDSAIQVLETEIDAMQSELPAIGKFTIPPRDERVALCHVCRTVCRRAERRVTSAAAQHTIEPNVEIYLNRLSDYLYLLGRTLTHDLQVEELLWTP